WALREHAHPQAQRQADVAVQFGLAAAVVGRFSEYNFLSPFCVNALPGRFLAQAALALSRTHALPQAVDLLAVREARRGTLAHPNEGYPYLFLGMAYDTLPHVGAELRSVQQVATLHQALARLTADEVEAYGPMVTQAYLILSDLH